MSDKMDSNFEHIVNKKEYIEKKKNSITEETMAQFQRQYALDFTYESLALSGSSLTKEEVKMILENNKKQHEILNETNQNDGK